MCLYLGHFAFYISTNTVIWSGDEKHYVRYTDGEKILYNIHKPILWVGSWVVGLRYVIGHHHDPDGVKAGSYRRA